MPNSIIFALISMRKYENKHGTSNIRPITFLSTLTDAAQSSLFVDSSVQVQSREHAQQDAQRAVQGRAYLAQGDQLGGRCGTNNTRRYDTIWYAWLTLTCVIVELGGCAVLKLTNQSLVAIQLVSWKLVHSNWGEYKFRVRTIWEKLGRQTS